MVTKLQGTTAMLLLLGAAAQRSALHNGLQPPPLDLPVIPQLLLAGFSCCLQRHHSQGNNTYDTAWRSWCELPGLPSVLSPAARLMIVLLQKLHLTDSCHNTHGMPLVVVDAASVRLQGYCALLCMLKVLLLPIFLLHMIDNSKGWACLYACC